MPPADPIAPSAPVVSAPAPVPDALAPPAPAPVTEPALAPAPDVPQATPEPSPVDAPEQPVEGDGVKAPAEEPSLLEGAGAEPEKKADAEPLKPGEAPKPDGEQKPAFDFKPYVAPEGVKLDEGRFKDLNEVLVNDKLDPQARGQALIDLHVKEMKAYADNLRQEQNAAFSETRHAWQKEAMGDGEYGGSGFKTAMTAVARMRDMLVAEKDRPAFNQFLRVTGAGDHPEFLRILVNAAKFFDEPAMPSQPYAPPPDIGRKPGTRARRASIYDHPSSHVNKSG